MVLLSCSVKERELQALRKTHTIRKFSPGRFRQLWNATTYQVWWKSRTKDRYKLYDAIPDGKPYLMQLASGFEDGRLTLIMWKAEVADIADIGKEALAYWKLSDQDRMAIVLREGFDDAPSLRNELLNLNGSLGLGSIWIGVPFIAQNVDEKLWKRKI